MTSSRELPVWRSLLFVPLTVERFVEKAPTVGADGLQLDLEDSIAPSQKEQARALLPDVARRYAEGGHDVVVRINRPWRLALPDLEAAVSPHVMAITLPKADSAAHVVAISEVIAELEAERGMTPGHTKLMVLVETPQGFERMSEIASADARVIAMGLGTEDFAAAINAEPLPEVLLAPKQQMVVAAYAAGVRPMGLVGSIADYKDLDRIRDIVRLSKKIGLRGASCIHPNQVLVCNEEFAPSGAEVESARRIVAAYEDAHGRGVGAIEVEGIMVDIPVAERARELLRIHEAIEARLTRGGAR
ncbi:MAG: CoA ester lyase [SAR324 cluster bacterium]|nr:CoA ester lyase [SAR324 cluster bacterium]